MPELAEQAFDVPLQSAVKILLPSRWRTIVEEWLNQGGGSGLVLKVRELGQRLAAGMDKLKSSSFERRFDRLPCQDGWDEKVSPMQCGRGHVERGCRHRESGLPFEVVGERGRSAKDTGAEMCTLLVIPCLDNRKPIPPP